jgi:sugar (pentulose or hexulose) kinase
MSKAVYLGIDLGTQSARTLAVTADGEVAASASAPLSSTRDGARHEQSPEQWWQAVATTTRSVMAALGSDVDVRGLAIDATSGTILLMDKQLRALTPGLMYDDGRAQEEAKLANEAGAALWSKLGYRMQPSWALPKLLWLARNKQIPIGAKLAHQNDYINTRLAGSFVNTDSSNSLKTGFDLIRMQWPQQIFDLLGLDAALFPDAALPGTRIGEVCAAASEETGLPKGTAIFAGMTDGCAAQIASGATTPGSWNSVLGTTLVMKGVTQELLRDPLGVIYSHRSSDGMWLPGGASSIGAGIISKEFAVDDLPALNDYALRVGPTDIIAYPLAGQGERYPFSAPAAQAFMLGEPRSDEERYTAILQGIAFVERLAFDALRALGASTAGSLTISGGATKSEALNALRADMMQRPLGIPAVTEGAMGMAILAAASESTIGEVTSRMVRLQRTIDPQRDFSLYADKYLRLVHELHQRGWLPQSLLDAAVKGASA